MSGTSQNTATSNSLPVLPQIHIATPCHMNWNKMNGDEAKKFCGSCQKSVHNLSEMTQDEVRSLIASGEKVCVKLKRTPDGTIYTKPSHRSGHTQRRWLARIGSMAASLIAIITLSGCDETSPEVTGGAVPDNAAQAPMIMGEVGFEEMGDLEMVVEPTSTSSPNPSPKSN